MNYVCSSEAIEVIIKKGETREDFEIIGEDVVLYKGKKYLILGKQQHPRYNIESLEVQTYIVFELAEIVDEIIEIKPMPLKHRMRKQLKALHGMGRG